MDDTSYRSDGDYYARPRVRIRNSQTGTAVNNATVYIYQEDNAGNTRTVTCQTGSNGRCSVTWRRGGARWPVVAYVYQVNSSPSWDGAAATISMPRP